jgi:hypothetical protein
MTGRGKGHIIVVDSGDKALTTPLSKETER